MNRPAAESGFSFTEFLIGLAALVLLAMTGLKLFPLYNEKMKVDTALEQLAIDPVVATQDRATLVGALVRRLEVADVDRFSAPELLSLVDLRANTRGGRSLSLAYDMRRDFCCDLDVVLKYHHTVDLPAGPIP